MRNGDAMLISPSAVPYDTMTPEMVVEMPIGGRLQWPLSQRCHIVMVGLVPTIHDFRAAGKVVDGRPSPTMTVEVTTSRDHGPLV